MCNLPDCLIEGKQGVALARQDGCEDALAQRKLRKPYSPDPCADLAYRHSYAETAFHCLKQTMLAKAVDLGGSAA